MKVFIEKTSMSVNANAKTVDELLKNLKLNPTTVIVTRENEILLEKEKLNSKDKIKILSVVSGG